MLDIKKEDFELLPTKMSIARLYAENLNRLSNVEHIKTHEDLFDELDKEYFQIFGQPLPFASFDSFRKFLTKYRDEIYRKP